MKAELITQKERTQAANVIPLEVVEACEVVEFVEVEKPALLFNVNAVDVYRGVRWAGSGLVWLTWTGTKNAVIVGAYILGGVLVLSVEFLTLVWQIVRGFLDVHGYHVQRSDSAEVGQGRTTPRTGGVTIINEVRANGGSVHIENRVL